MKKNWIYFLGTALSFFLLSCGSRQGQPTQSSNAEEMEEFLFQEKYKKIKAFVENHGNYSKDVHLLGDLDKTLAALEREKGYNDNVETVCKDHFFLDYDLKELNYVSHETVSLSLLKITAADYFFQEMLKDYLMFTTVEPIAVRYGKDSLKILLHASSPDMNTRVGFSLEKEGQKNSDALDKAFSLSLKDTRLKHEGKSISLEKVFKKKMQGRLKGSYTFATHSVGDSTFTININPGILDKE